MKYYNSIIIILLLFTSCTSDNELKDPLEGLANGFKYDGKLYNSPGFYYDLYNKINHQYYYYFLIGTTGQFEPNKIISKAQIAGNFVRILLTADSLDKIDGEYDIEFNDLNIVSIDNGADTIKEGRLILKKGINKRQIIEVRATTQSNKRLDLRAEFNTGSIAYRVYRTVEGNFSLHSKSYDISRVSTVYKAGESRMAIEFMDDNDVFATVIAFNVDETDGILDPAYPVNGGLVSIYDYSISERIYFSYFADGQFEFINTANGYDIKFEINTSLGDVVKGEYKGVVEQL